MKKFISIILTVCMILSVSSVSVSANERLQTKDIITITIDGEYLDCSVYGQLPVAINGSTLVPLRSVFEALGATVKWDADTSSVVSFKDDVSIILALNSTQMYVSGEIKTLSVPAQSMNNRIMVPVRAIAEAFGCDVRWDGDTRTVVISTLVSADSPEEVVKKAFEALFDLDTEELSKYAIDSSESFGDLSNAISSLTKTEGLTEDEARLAIEYTKKILDLCTVEVGDAVITGDTAVVNTTLYMPNFDNFNMDNYLTDAQMEELLIECLAGLGYTVEEFVMIDDPAEMERIEKIWIETLLNYTLEVFEKEAQNAEKNVTTDVTKLEKINGKWFIVE